MKELRDRLERIYMKSRIYVEDVVQGLLLQIKRKLFILFSIPFFNSVLTV